MSAISVKVDENLARSHVALLERAGYDAQSVYDQELSGAEDAALWEV